MLKRFLPKRDIFFDQFEKHAAISCEAAKQLILFHTEKHTPSETYAVIKALEHEADTVTHRCVEMLHKTFITPIDRMDIYRLICTLDNITDEIEDIAKSIVLYRLENLREDALKLAEILLASTREVHAAVKEFRKMKISAQLRDHFIKINHLENEADTILMQALGRLFDEENETKTLIKWKETYEHLEKVTDVCEDVSNILEGIILEND